MTLIIPAIKIAQKVFKYRKQLYRVLVAQDRAIDKAFKVGGYSRSTRYGARHGALAGSLIGSLINNADDSPGNGIQTPFRKQPSANQSYQTRYRRPIQYRAQCRENYRDRRSNRYSSARRF